jgi:8-oxo-dGTP pyrophosphatase MutT (NUDIX family)
MGTDPAPGPGRGSATFTKLDERSIYEGAVISVAVGRFAGPDGDPFERDVVHHPGAVSAVPLLADGTVVLIRQYRAALDEDLLEIPAGKRDVAGEEPGVTAARELEEEIGMRPGRLELLAEFYNSPGFSDEHSYVFLAEDLVETATDLQGIEEEHLVVERVPLADIPAMIADGRLRDAKTIIGLTLAMRALDER